jgi:hypothetical protein
MSHFMQFCGGEFRIATEPPSKLSSSCEMDGSYGALWPMSDLMFEVFDDPMLRASMVASESELDPFLAGGELMSTFVPSFDSYHNVLGMSAEGSAASKEKDQAPKAPKTSKPDPAHLNEVACGSCVRRGIECWAGVGRQSKCWPCSRDRIIECSVTSKWGFLRGRGRGDDS